MKKAILFSTVLFSAISAHALQPTLKDSLPGGWNAGDTSTHEVFIRGNNLRPAYGTAENESDVEVSVRKVGATMTPWIAAYFSDHAPSDTNNPAVLMHGNDNIKLWLPTRYTDEPGVIEVMVCIRTVGCSNLLSIPVTPTSFKGSVNITTVGPIDVVVPDPIPGYVATVKLDVTGLTSYSPSMKINGKTIEGLGHYQEGQAWFYLDSSVLPKGGLYSATVIDPVSGESNQNIYLRAFTKPALTGISSNHLIENLSGSQKPQDTSVQFTFGSFTFPSTITITDGLGNKHTVNPSLDLITNKASVAISGSWLKVGTQDLKFDFSNVAGSSMGTLVRVDVNQTVIHPIPHPIPLPTPHR